MKKTLLFLLAISLITYSKNAFSTTKALAQETIAMVGVWQIETVDPSLQANPILRNTYLEIFGDKVGISRNDSINTTANVRLFTWSCNGDTLFIDTLLKGKQHRRVLTGLFNVDDMFLKVTILTKGKVPGRAGYSQTNMTLTCHRVKDDPMDDYSDYLPSEVAEGRWISACQLKNGIFSNQQDQYFDIHPSNNNYGEIITNPRVSIAGQPEQLNFIKYIFAESIYAATFLKINSNSTKADTTKHYEFYQLVHKDEPMAKVFCFCSYGVIMLQYEDGHTLYLIKTGSPKWTDVAALHYTFAKKSKIILQPFGFHHHTCLNCGGTGRISQSVRNSEPDREAVGTDNGRTVYDNIYHDHMETSVCSVCNGEGSYDESDDAPVLYNASLGYSSTTAVVGTDVLPGGYVKINLFLTYSCIKADDGAVVECSNNYNVTDNAQWIIVPLRHSEFFLIKNKLKGTYLSVDQHNVVLSADGKSNNAKWKFQVSPTADFYAQYGTSGKIWNAANNEFIYIDDTKLGTSSDVWNHLTSAMWNVKQVSQ